LSHECCVSAQVSAEAAAPLFFFVVLFFAAADDDDDDDGAFLLTPALVLVLVPLLPLLAFRFTGLFFAVGIVR
jgi:hypothetical protein